MKMWKKISEGSRTDFLLWVLALTARGINREICGSHKFQASMYVQTGKFHRALLDVAEIKHITVESFKSTYPLSCYQH